MNATDACGSCSNCSIAQLKRLGLNISGFDYIVALAGNPNTGKSTIFNALTGMRQHVGNWPGKTVMRAEGAFSSGSAKFKLVDLPGTYSLLSQSADEEIARDFILFGRPDVTVVVVDATCLERNLNLVLQVLEITGRVVIALNLMDEAKRNGIEVDARALAKDLGVPIVPMSARHGVGVPELVSAIDEVAKSDSPPAPRRTAKLPANVEAAVDDLAERIEREFQGLPNARWVALRLLEGDPSVVREVKNGTLGESVHSVSMKQAAGGA